MSRTHPTQPAGRDADHARRTTVTARLLEDSLDASDPAHRQELLDRVICLNMPVARAVARHYRGRGVGDDDLDQVAYVALVYAVQHFDASHGVSFLGYAVPTIRGSVKKHFRDFGWTVRPPRRVQELEANARRAFDDLAQALGRSPLTSEMAEHLDVDVDAVREALTTDGCYVPTSLDRPAGADANATLGEVFHDDANDGSGAQEAAEARVIVTPAVRRLRGRDQHIVHLRFVKQMTQSEIADDIGVTQMQVSRLLCRIMRDLHRDLTHEPAH